MALFSVRTGNKAGRQPGNRGSDVSSTTPRGPPEIFRISWADRHVDRYIGVVAQMWSANFWGLPKRLIVSRQASHEHLTLPPRDSARAPPLFAPGAGHKSRHLLWTDARAPASSPSTAARPMGLTSLPWTEIAPAVELRRLFPWRPQTMTRPEHVCAPSPDGSRCASNPILRPGYGSAREADRT
jgi:hypothetical protein